MTQANRCCSASILHWVEWKFVNPIQSCRCVGTVPWPNGVTRDTTASDIDIRGGVSNQGDIGHRTAVSSGASGVAFPLRYGWWNGKPGADASKCNATNGDGGNLHFNSLRRFLRSDGG